MSTGPFLTVMDVAVRLRISRNSAWRLIRNGKLRAVDVGTADKKRFRVLSEDFDAYLEAQRTGADVEAAS